MKLAGMAVSLKYRKSALQKENMIEVVVKYEIKLYGFLGEKTKSWYSVSLYKYNRGMLLHS